MLSLRHLTFYSFDSHMLTQIIHFLKFLGSPSCALLNQCASSKHRETQLQLQRKLQERELIREQKKKMLEHRYQLERCHSEKPASKSSRKGHISRQHADLSRSSTLTSLTENGSADCIVRHIEEVDSSKIDDPKEENENQMSLSHEIAEKTTVKSSSRRSSISETKVRTASGDTPVHFRHDCRSVTASPCRRKSGDTSRGSSPRSASLDVGFNSNNSNGGWATRSLEDSCKVSSNGNNTSKISRGRTPDSLKGSSGVPETNKTGKVLIPRVTCSQTSKMRFSTPTSIIILPPISTVPLTTDYGATQSKPKLKYKPIQPKPVHQRADSDEGKTSESPLTEEKSGTLDGNCRGHDLSTNPTIRRDTSCSSSSNSNLSEIHLPSDSAGNTDGSLLSDCNPESCSNRRSKRSNEAQQGQRGCNKRLCHEVSECEEAEEHPQYKPSKGAESGSPQEEMSISTLENDALMEYIHDTPSADQEDELLQYFGGDGVDRHLSQEEPIKAQSVVNHGAQSAELSQLRKLLERNFHGKNSLPNSETSGRGSVSDMECSKTDSQCETIQTSTTKDTMPTLRLLLSEQRQAPNASLRPNTETVRIMDCSHLLNGATDDDDSGRMLHSSSSRIDSLFTQHYEQDVDHGEGHLSNEDLEVTTSQIDSKPLRYLGGPSRLKEEEEMWTYETAKESVKNETQVPLVSGTLLDAELSATAPTLGVLDAPHVDPLTDDHQVSAQPLNTEMASFNVKPYPTCGNPVFVHHSESHSSVPPSPNTRVKAFNFMPISPRNTPVPETRSSTQSPLPYLVGVPAGGHITATLRSSVPQTPTTASSSQSACATASSSQPASATTSPFVSPRSTPSSLSRSRHNSGQASSSFGTPRATPHAAYAIDQPSCLTSSPFMSPHPTPVPFSTRSRHNSSQSVHRTCGIPYSGSSSSVSTVPSRSRHPSELGGINLLSPGSAPMSPLEHHGGICDIDIPCGLQSGSHYPVMPSYGDAIPHMRSRHNSSSSIPPNSPRSAPMSPMVAASALIAQDSYSPDQTVPYGKSTVTSSPGPSSLPPPPPPPLLAPPPPPSLQRHLLTTSDVPHSDDRVKVVNPPTWSGDIQRHPLSFMADSGQQSQVCWAPAAPHRQIDPRLVSRHRHASVGSASHHITIPLHPHSHQVPHLDASSREVSQLMQKPLPPQLDSAQVCNRSQSVPLCEMLQYGLKQDEPLDAPFGDVLMSRSYPATPTGQQSFTFRTDSSVDSGVASLGPAMNSQEFPDFSSGGRGGEVDGEQLYHGDQLGCEPARRSLSDTLDLPPDQFQDMIPSNLDDFISDEINMFAQELEQFASNTQP